MKKRVFAATIFFLLAVFFCGAASAAGEKFVRVYRDDSYDMYLNTNALVQNRGVISCWIKVVLSDKGKAGLRQDLPAKYKQARIDYEMDYIVFDTNKGKYNVKMSSVYSEGKEIYREGSKKWLSLRSGTIAKTVADNISGYIQQKRNEKDNF